MMLDDQLFGAFMLADQLDLSIEEMFAMPYKHALAWDAAMQRKAVESRSGR